jgi:hypothetical protein
MTYSVLVEGLAGLQMMDGMNERIRRSAVQAINKTSARARTDSAAEIRRQVSFSAQYLAPGAGRLVVSKQASGASLESVITARQRATSLARFAEGSPGRGAGVRVQVAPGRSRFMKRAFLIKLPAGKASVDTKFNMGLAIRLKPGESLQNKKKAIKMEKGLYLLYGPSVDQVFQSVSQEIAPGAATYLEAEFLRLLDLKNV